MVSEDNPVQHIRNHERREKQPSPTYQKSQTPRKQPGPTYQKSRTPRKTTPTQMWGFPLYYVRGFFQNKQSTPYYARGFLRNKPSTPYYARGFPPIMLEASFKINCQPPTHTWGCRSFDEWIRGFARGLGRKHRPARSPNGVKANAQTDPGKCGDYPATRVDANVQSKR